MPIYLLIQQRVALGRFHQHCEIVCLNQLLRIFIMHRKCFIYCQKLPQRILCSPDLHFDRHHKCWIACSSPDKYMLISKFYFEIKLKYKAFWFKFEIHNLSDKERVFEWLNYNWMWLIYLPARLEWWFHISQLLWRTHLVQWLHYRSSQSIWSSLGELVAQTAVP